MYKKKRLNSSTLINYGKRNTIEVIHKLIMFNQNKFMARIFVQSMDRKSIFPSLYKWHMKSNLRKLAIFSVDYYV